MRFKKVFLIVMALGVMACTEDEPNQAEKCTKLYDSVIFDLRILESKYNRDAISTSEYIQELNRLEAELDSIDKICQ